MEAGSLSATASQGFSTNISTAPLIRTPGFHTRCHDILNRPSASFLGRTIRTITLSIILGSTVLFVLQSIPSLASWNWGALDALIAVIFTLEYGAKLLVAPDGRGDEELDHLRRSTPRDACHARIRFMREPMSVIDLLALLPFWLGLFSGGSGFWSQLLRSLRLVRILRMLRLAQESTEVRKPDSNPRRLPCSSLKGEV
jgi:voltage-gated potassium channel